MRGWWQIKAWGTASYLVVVKEINQAGIEGKYLVAHEDGRIWKSKSIGLFKWEHIRQLTNRN